MARSSSRPSTRKFWQAAQSLQSGFSRQGLYWLLRSGLVTGRKEPGGFLLPTVTLMLLVLSLVVGTLVFRTFNRTAEVIGQRQQRALYNAATPAIDRAKLKLEYLFEEAGLSTPPSDADLVTELENTALYDLKAQGTTSAETRLDLNGDGELDSAWRYTTDIDGDGDNEVVAYSILTRSQSVDGTIGLENDDAAKAAALVVRNGPINLQDRGTDCSNVSDSAYAAWEPVTSSDLRKAVQVHAVVLDVNAAGTGVDNAVTATLEMQQDRQANLGNRWGAWFRNDLELHPTSTGFRWNGAIHTEGSFMMHNDPTLYLVSSPSSCIYTRSASEVSMAAWDLNGDGATDFQGQFLAGRIETNTSDGGAIVDAYVPAPNLSGSGENRVTITPNTSGTNTIKDSVDNGGGKTLPAQIALNPITLFTEDLSEARSGNVDNLDSRDEANTDWTTFAKPLDDSAGTYNQRLFNDSTSIPFLDDTYRADDRLGPVVGYGSSSSATSCGKEICVSSTTMGNATTDTDLVQNDPLGLATPDEDGYGYDGYWERRARRTGVRIIVGQRLELGNRNGWQGYENGNEDPLYPPNADAYDGSNMENRGNELRQWRTLRDNLAAVQSAAIYHYRNDTGDYIDGSYPVACMAMTAHPGTKETDTASRTFNTLVIPGTTIQVTSALSGLNNSYLYQIDFLTGTGVNGIEFEVPFSGAADPEAAFATAVDTANSPLHKALWNLAYFAGDPAGAFPADQDRAAAHADNAAAVYGSYADAAATGVVHPYPQMAMWGDFSNLRRVLSRLDAASPAVNYADLSPAEKTTLHTATCTLGMLGYNLVAYQELKEVSGVSGSLTSVGGKVQSLMEGSAPSNGSPEIGWDPTTETVYLCAQKMYHFSNYPTSLAVVAENTVNTTYCPHDANSNNTYGVYNNEDYNLKAAAAIGATSITVDNGKSGGQLGAPAVTLSVGDKFMIVQEANDGDLSVSNPRDVYEITAVNTSVAGQHTYTFSPALVKALDAGDDLHLWNPEFYMEIPSEKWLEALALWQEALPGNSPPDAEALISLRFIKDFTQITADRRFGFANDRAITLANTGGSGYGGSYDKDTGLYVTDSDVSLGSSIGKFAPFPAVGCDPNIFGLSQVPSELGLAVAICGLGTDSDIRYPSLYYLFPVAEHAHDGILSATASARATTLNNGLYEVQQPEAGKSMPVSAGNYSASETYIVDAGVNGSNYIFDRANSRGVNWNKYYKVVADVTSGIENTPDSNSSVEAFVNYLQMEPRALTAPGTWTTPLDTTGSGANTIFVDAASSDGVADATWSPAFLDVGIFNSREQMSTRVLSIDLDLMRQRIVGAGGDSTQFCYANDPTSAAEKTGANADQNGLCWLPLPTLMEESGGTTSTGALIYAFREDAVREDAIARPTRADASGLTCATDGAAWTTAATAYVNATTDSSPANGKADLLETNASGLDAADFLMDAVGTNGTNYYDPPINPCTGVSPKPVDFYADPDRRPHGFALRNGADLRRQTGASAYDTLHRPFTFVTDNLAYIWGDFNLHSTTGATQNLEEFESGSVLANDWSNFYTRTDRNNDFADAADNDADSVIDTWRVAEIVADGVTVLDNDFDRGFNDFDRGFIAQGLMWTNIAEYNNKNSYGGLNILTEAATFNNQWVLEDGTVTGAVVPNSLTSPLKISREGFPIYQSGGVDTKYGDDSERSTDERWESMTSNKQDRIFPAFAASAGTAYVNATIVSGITPSRANHPYGGLHNFLRLIGNWSGDTLEFSGSFLQLNFSKYSAPFAVNAWEAGTIDTGTSYAPYYVEPTRDWSYDVALQYAPAGTVAARLSAPSSDRSEFYRELAIDDPYVSNLLCAEYDSNSDSTPDTRVDPRLTDADCP